MHRCIWISVLVVLIGSGAFTASHAADITVLDVSYTADVGGCGNESSSSPVSVNCTQGQITAFATTGGSIGAASGSLTSSAEELAFAGGGATATISMDFKTMDPVLFDVTTSGRPSGESAGTIELTDMTHNIVLLDFSRSGFDISDLTKSFAFSLNPGIDYRLQVDSDLPGNDFAQANASYTVANPVADSVPEPSSFALLVPGVVMLGMAFRKLSGVRR